MRVFSRKIAYKSFLCSVWVRRNCREFLFGKVFVLRRLVGVFGRVKHSGWFVRGKKREKERKKEREREREREREDKEKEMKRSRD